MSQSRPVYICEKCEDTGLVDLHDGDEFLFCRCMTGRQKAVAEAIEDVVKYTPHDGTHIPSWAKIIFSNRDYAAALYQRIKKQISENPELSCQPSSKRKQMIQIAMREIHDMNIRDAHSRLKKAWSKKSEVKNATKASE